MSRWAMAAAVMPLLAQTPDVGSSSVVVFGLIYDGRGNLKPAGQSGGFLAEAQHVITGLGGCCGKIQGQQMVPRVIIGEEEFDAQLVWSSEELDAAVLELEEKARRPPAVLAPAKLVRKGQTVYTVQFFSVNNPPRMSEGEIQDIGKPESFGAELIVSSARMMNGNAGGGLFDACGNAVGMNLAAQNDRLASVALDQIIGVFEARGVPVKVAAKACGDLRKEGEEKSAPPGLRWPRGREWVGVALLIGIALLAFRPARQQVARALTLSRIPVPSALPGPPPATKPVLRGVAGHYADSVIPLESGMNTLGRDPSAANLVFGAEVASVSKRHCTVRWDAGRGVFLLEDLGSTNGTFLASGERLEPHQPRELKPGDRFYIGDLRQQFELSLEP